MALTLSCPCGATFEVEETFAAQEVICPQCRQPVRAPASTRNSVQTCDFAIIGLLLTLVGAFTVIGTLLGIGLGIVSLLRIRKQRHRLAGTGYALSAIILGLIFTGASLFAYSAGELFPEEKRKLQIAGALENDRDTELVYKKQGFSVKRPSPAWRTAKKEYIQTQDSDEVLILVNSQREAECGIAVVDNVATNAADYLDLLIEEYRKLENNLSEPIQRRYSKITVRDRSKPSKDGLDAAQCTLDLLWLRKPWVHRIRVVHSPDTNTTYIITARAPVRVFRTLESEIDEITDSFALMDRE